MSKYVAVTGCAGFIGRVVTRKLLERGDYVYGIDALTYAADPRSVEGFARDFPDSFCFRPVDILSLGRFPDTDAVIHLAAETHVDNSLTEGPRFVETNIDGTVHLLEMTRAKSQHGMPHFIHISTDEVYGPVEKDRRDYDPDRIPWHPVGKAIVEDPLNPTSPYAASKAASDLLVQAWGKTYGVPYSIVRPTNCYGLGQYPEKLIPKAVRSLMLGRPIPIHGDGTQTRMWLWTEDLADAILLILDQRLEGIYNVGGNAEVSVNAVVHGVMDAFDGDRPLDVEPPIQRGFVRPAGDIRYSVDDSPIRLAGWAPKGDFCKDLPGLVQAARGRFRF